MVNPRQGCTALGCGFLGAKALRVSNRITGFMQAVSHTSDENMPEELSELQRGPGISYGPLVALVWVRTFFKGL